MENYFILLELSFDPPENDTKKINDVIAKKQAQWSRDMFNPVRKGRASEYLANLEDIKKVMNDPAARKQQAVKAKQIKDSKKKELETKLKSCRTKGNSLLDNDLKQLVKLFGVYGFSEDEIKAMFQSGTGKDEKIDPKKVLDKTTAMNMKVYLRDLDMANKTLYDFLGIDKNSSCSQLCEAANTIKRKVLAKGEKSGRDNSIQSLCGLCVVIFKDEAGKQKYDNYINLTKYGVVNDELDELALGNEKRIEPKMKEGLIDIAVSQYHISVSDASIYINNYCEYMGYALPENKIVCGLCGAENPAGTTNCVKCGKALIIHCPVCEAGNNNSAKSCAKCGFDLTKMDKAVELLRQAKQKYAEMALEEAKRLVKEAKAYWPKHADIEALEKTIQEELDWRANTVAKIRDDIKNKRIYAAQTKIEQAKAKGFIIDSAISANVSSVLKEVGKQLTMLRNASGDEAFLIAMRTKEIIADSEELNKSMARFSPESPIDFNSKRIGDEVVLSWKASPSIGEIYYQVIRKVNTYPNGPQDGESIYKGKELTFTDRKLSKNTVYYYSVFAIRLDVYSKAARLNDAIAIVDKITNVKAIGGHEMVTLSWGKTSTVTEIHVWKYCGMGRPQDDGAYEVVPCNRLDGLTINHLKNGQSYWFAISAVHNINGRNYDSEKTYISAVPQKPAKPLQGFSVEFVDEVFQAKWEQSEWDVILFYAKSKPNYAVGTIYDLNEILAKYEKIDTHLKSAAEAEFRISFVGECYIIPGIINASNVILNVPAYISSVPGVKNISCDVNAAATEMYVNFTWPRKMERSLMVYRMDTYPTGYDDPLANRIECSKRQYEANEGILINKPAQGTYYVEIYTYLENDGRRIYSDPCRAMFSNEPPRDVFYSFKYKKPGFFNKKCTLKIEIETNGTCVLPAFVVIGKYKSTPLKRSDGDIICTVNENVEIKGIHTYEFDIAPLRAEMRLKLFFLNDKDYKSFKIACKAGNII